MIESLLTNRPAWIQLGIVLAHFLWQGAAIAMLLAAALWLLRHRSPNARYILCGAAMLLMAACPAITLSYVRAHPLPTLAIRPPTAPPQINLPPRQNIPDTEIVNATQEQETIENVNVSPNSPHEQAFTPSPQLDHPRIDPPASDNSALRQMWLARGLEWSALVWSIGVLVLSLRLIIGWWRLRRLARRDTECLPDAVEAIVRRLSERLQVTHRVRVLAARAWNGPAAFGLLKPVVLMPVAVLTQCPLELIEAMIAHELAHIRRYDLWVNLLQRVIETLLFYHPAIWWVSGRMRMERELCCDDLAVQATGRRADYATALVEICRLQPSWVTPAMAAGIFGPKLSLLTRVRRVLQSSHTPGESNRGRFWLSGPLSIMLAGAFVFLASLRAADTCGLAATQPAERDNLISTRPTALVQNDLDWSDKKFPWIPYNREQALQAVQDGHTVFIDYTAEWAANCKANEKIVIDTQEVRQAMKRLGVLPFQADYTSRDPQIKTDLDRYGRGGVPMYLIIPAHRPEPENAILLDEVLTKVSLIAGLEKAGPSVRADSMPSQPNATTLPQLRALAWQNQYDDAHPVIWHPDGQPIKDHAEIQQLKSVSVGKSSDSQSPATRYLHMWFSHPAFDRQNEVRIDLLDRSGHSIINNAIGRTANPAEGWYVCTLPVLTTIDLANPVDVVFHFSAGTWELQSTSVGPGFDGAVGRGKEIFITNVGQSAKGQAFVILAGNGDMNQKTQYSFLCITNDDRELNQIGKNTMGSERVLSMRYEFDVPLSQVKEFRQRTRPVRSLTFRNVSLQSGKNTEFTISKESAATDAEQQFLAVLRMPLSRPASESPPPPPLLQLHFDNTPLRKAVEEFSQMSGLRVIGINSIHPDIAKTPITLVIPQPIAFDEALTAFDQVILDAERAKGLVDSGIWIVRREHGLVIRQLTEWYHHIPAQNWFASEADYRQAKLPGWELARVRYKPRALDTAYLVSLATDAVPYNTSRVFVDNKVPSPNDAAFDLAGFVYFINAQLDVLARRDVLERSQMQNPTEILERKTREARTPANRNPASQPTDQIPADVSSQMKSRTPRQNPTPSQNQNLVPVRTLADGIITNVKVKEGQVVKKGDLLVQLDDTEARLDLEAAEVRTQDIERARENQAKFMTLPEAVIKRVESNARLADIELRRCRLRLERTQIKSPADGTACLGMISKRINAGEILMYVQTAQFAPGNGQAPALSGISPAITSQPASGRGTVLDQNYGEITKAYDVRGSVDDIAIKLDKTLVTLWGYSDAPYVKSLLLGKQIVVTGKPAQFKTVEEWLEKLDKPSSPRTRHFVKLVLGKGRMTFQGEDVTWDELPERLKRVPDREHTVFEFAHTPENLTLSEFNEARFRAMKLQQELGFEYFSEVGEHPLGSKGSPDQFLSESPAATQPAVAPKRHKVLGIGD